MRHELKILPAYFKAVENGSKTFEIRDNSDRGFQTGDMVLLKEYDKTRVINGGHGMRCPYEEPVGFTGKEILVEITYVTNFMQKENWVVFGFKRV